DPGSDTCAGFSGGRIRGLRTSWGSACGPSYATNGVSSIGRGRIPNGCGAFPSWSGTIRANSLPVFHAFDPNKPNSFLLALPPCLERAIATRWIEWIPWVYRDLRRRGRDGSISSPEFMRLRERHSEHILHIMRTGISMRTIRRHRLDDPRITDEIRTMLLEAATQRPPKAKFSGSEAQCKKERLATLIRLASTVRNAATTGSDGGSAEERSQAGMALLDPLAVPAVIQTIRQHVCEYFYLREMCDPELTVRTNRRVYVLPRQIAMYIVRQIT